MKPNLETAVSASKCRSGGAAIGFVRVAEYRLYGLDGVNKVASGEWFDAEDDETAIEVAKTMMDGHDCELWKAKQFVARIPHQGQALTRSG